MKIIVVGGTGTIGTALVSLLRRDHEVIAIGKTKGDYQVDIEDKATIEKIFEDFKEVDGVISTTGMGGLAPFPVQTDEDLDLAINSKLRGQVDLIRVASKYVKDNGFIIVTSGTASHTPIPGSSCITMALAGLEGYVKAIQGEKDNGIRVSAVSPVFVTETAEKMGIDMPGTVSAADTAKVYQMVMESADSGIVADVSQWLA